MASTCIQMKQISRLRLYALDSCGRLPVATTVAALDWDGYNSVSWAPNITDGDEEIITNTAGGICIDDFACPQDKGEDVTLIGCKENDTLSALLGMGSIILQSTTPVGFDRTNINCNPLVAMEIIFQTPTICSGGSPVCPAILFPLITKWKDTSTRTADGKSTIRGTFTGKAAKNGRLFELWSSGAKVPTELAHWLPYVTQVSAGTQWYLKRYVTCPDLSAFAQGCELRAISASTP